MLYRFGDVKNKNSNNNNNNNADTDTNTGGLCRFRYERVYWFLALSLATQGEKH